MEFTVGIPTHKPGPYIYKCLDSLCRQTMAATEFEVIIVLNGPKDPYFQQIDDYLRQHADTLNARLLHTEVMGVSNARNLILDQAQGDSRTSGLDAMACHEFPLMIGQRLGIASLPRHLLP